MEPKVCPIRVFDMRGSEEHRDQCRAFHKPEKGKPRIFLNGKEVGYCFLFNLDTSEVGWYPERNAGEGPYGIDGRCVTEFATGNLEYYDGEGQRWI